MAGAVLYLFVIMFVDIGMRAGNLAECLVCRGSMTANEDESVGLGREG